MNKISIGFIIILSLLWTIGIAQSPQSIVSAQHDSLMVYKSQKEYKKYFSILRSEEDALYRNKTAHRKISDYNIYYDEFLDSNELSNKQFLRSNLLYHAFYLKKEVGFRESLPYYLLAHRSLSSLDSIDNLSWYTENEIGNSYARLGDYQQAQYYYRLVEKYLKANIEIKNNKINLARLATNQGISYKSEGKYEKAIKKYKTAFITSKQDGLKDAEMSNARELSSTYILLDQIDSANHYFNIANTSLLKQPELERYYEDLSDLYITKASILSKENNYDQSLKFLAKSEDALYKYYGKKEGRSFGKLYLEYAKIHLINDSKEQCARYLQLGFASIIPSFGHDQILPDDWQITRENTFYDLLEVNAQFYKGKYKKEQISSYLDSALYCIDLAYIANDKLREKHTNNAASLISVSTNKKLFNQSIETIYQLYTTTDQDKYVKKAVELSDRSKGVLFKGKLKEGKAFNLLSQDDKQQIAELEQKLIGLYEVQEQIDNKRDSTFIEIHQIKNKIEEILAIPTTNKTTQSSTQYVEYIITDKNVFSIDNFDDNIQFKRLGTRDELFSLLNSINKQLLDKKSANSISKKLFDFLFGTDNNLPEKFVVIPDDNLAILPFELLKQNGKWLLEDHEISYAYHNQQLGLNQTTSSNEDKNMVCILPTYKKAPEIDLSMTRKDLFHLEYASAEVEKIMQLYKNKNKLISNISKQQLPNFIKELNILHFAGHAKAIDSDAYLAFDSSNKEDSRWYDFEIAESRNNMDLVVLSACETGIGKYHNGEGIQSLGRSFQAAGTKACLISLWSVNDKATSEIITSFYKYLKAGANKAESLKKAKLDYIKLADPAMASPYYWSGIILTGDINPLFPEKKPFWRSPFFILLTLLFISIIFYLITKQKTKL